MPDWFSVPRRPYRFVVAAPDEHLLASAGLSLYGLPSELANLLGKLPPLGGKVFIHVGHHLVAGASYLCQLLASLSLRQVSLKSCIVHDRVPNRKQPIAGNSFRKIPADAWPTNKRTPVEVDLPRSPETLVQPGGSTWAADDQIITGMLSSCDC